MNLARGENYKFWVFAALAIGLFASVADHGSVGVALPTIAEHFNTDLPTSQWVVIGYALTISAFLLPMGRLADIVGRKKIYLLGTVILITMGIAAGFAPNIGALIAAKLAQGIGSAMTQGTSMAMLIASFPSEERGKALGLQMSVVGTGNVAGPAVGGILVGELGWEWVFFATSIMATVGFWRHISSLTHGRRTGAPPSGRNSTGLERRFPQRHCSPSCKPLPGPRFLDSTIRQSSCRSPYSRGSWPPSLCGSSELQIP